MSRHGPRRLPLISRGWWEKLAEELTVEACGLLLIKLKSCVQTNNLGQTCGSQNHKGWRGAQPARLLGTRTAFSCCRVARNWGGGVGGRKQVGPGRGRATRGSRFYGPGPGPRPGGAGQGLGPRLQRQTCPTLFGGLCYEGLIRAVARDGLATTWTGFGEWKRKRFAPQRGRCPVPGLAGYLPPQRSRGFLLVQT